MKKFEGSHFEEESSYDVLRGIVREKRECDLRDTVTDLEVELLDLPGWPNSGQFLIRDETDFTTMKDEHGQYMYLGTYFRKLFAGCNVDAEGNQETLLVERIDHWTPYSRGSATVTTYSIHEYGTLVKRKSVTEDVDCNGSFTTISYPAFTLEDAQMLLSDVKDYKQLPKNV